MTLDAKTVAALRSAGIDPKKLPPGTKIGGKPIGETAVEVPKAPKGQNKTEAAWAQYLTWLVSIGKVRAYWYEPFRLRLTDPDPQTRRQTFYVPDFLIVMAEAWQCGDPRPRVVEVKGGFVREDSRVKFRLAMVAYSPAFRFSMVQKTKGTWKTIAGQTWTERMP